MIRILYTIYRVLAQ